MFGYAQNFWLIKVWITFYDKYNINLNFTLKYLLLLSVIDISGMLNMFTAIRETTFIWMEKLIRLELESIMP